jgi:hypothetical protein
MGETSGFKEKRRHPRVKMNKPVNFQVAGESGTRLGMVFDASPEGFLVQAFKNIPIGTRILIEVVSPKGFESPKGWAVAEIVWKDMYLWDDWEGYQYGIKFIRTSNKSHPEVKQIEPKQAGLTGKSLIDRSGHNEILIKEAKRQEAK